MEQREKRGQAFPRSVPRVKGRLRQEVLEEGLLVPSDVPDGLTNPYQRVRNSGTV